MRASVPLNAYQQMLGFATCSGWTMSRFYEPNNDPENRKDKRVGVKKIE